MIWPPEALWSRIASLWKHAYGPPDANAGERAKALAALKQIQVDFDLSDVQLAYIAEYQMLDPGSRVVRRERAENAFEIVLGVISEVGLVMPFEHFVVDAAWVLHTYIFPQFLHTPRLLIWSRGSGYGKTARLNCIQALANNPKYMIAPSPAVLYHQVKAHPQTTLLLDDMENADLWNRHSLLRQISDAGHRQGAPVPRVINHEIVWFPTFAPLALGTIVDRDRLYKFPPQVLSRSIVLEMKKSVEGQDEIFPDDPRFAPIRAVAARWAETFRRPKTLLLPKGIVARCANNWRVLVAIGDVLGYGATLRAAAVAVEAANFDPELRLYEDIYSTFKQRQETGLWVGELVQALGEIEDGPWASLSKDTLCDMLYRKSIEKRTVWKTGTDATRRSNKGFYRKQFEPLWRNLGYETQQAQSGKIIHLPRHKQGTGQTHDE
jgi:Protein of unknown function (DUF3631)